MSAYSTPGVYIEELTGPSVITGVSTSTAAFIGPTASGPPFEPTPITSLNDFTRQFGDPYTFVAGKPLYMGFAVEGFFVNGGQHAYIVRVSNGQTSRLILNDQSGRRALEVTALTEGRAGDGTQVEVQSAAAYFLATATANVTADQAAGVIAVDNPSAFVIGDQVTIDGATRANVTATGRGELTVDADLNAKAADTLRLAPALTGDSRVRLDDATGLRAGDRIRLGSNEPVVRTIDTVTEIITFSPPLATNAVDETEVTHVRRLATGQSHVINLAPATLQDATPGTALTVADASQFRVGDRVIDDQGLRTTVVQSIRADVLTVNTEWPASPQSIRLADLTPLDYTVRLESATGVYPGTVLLIESNDGTAQEYAIVTGVYGDILTLSGAQTRSATFTLDPAQPVRTIAQEFRLVVTPPEAGARNERLDNLSLEPSHPGYVFRALNSTWISVASADPTAPVTYPDSLLAIVSAQSLANGQEDQPLGLTVDNYQRGLDALADVHGPSIVCVPDASSHPTESAAIQEAIVTHCVDLKDRMAVLDSGVGLEPLGAGDRSVQNQLANVRATNGFAAFYYPWLKRLYPRSSAAQALPLLIPPCGHIAGVYARTDIERGVFKAPANTDVRGVNGLERVLSDRQQGPLNLLGVDVLRQFPGDNRVIVWGARTTGDPGITDWIYVNVRRLMIYIEQSIQHSIRWAVFEGNSESLWGSLKRTIDDFLTGIWTNGGLVGDKASEAFQVKIDSSINTPSTIALGELYVEILVAPVRPAEFIVVRIGMWQGGGTVSES